MPQLGEVFGVRTQVSEYSYVDRGNLDEALRLLSERDQHIALKGESKSGKSWLRQKIFPSSNVVQCRLTDTVETVYRQALANLGISLAIERSTTGTGKIHIEGTAEAGWKFIAKATGGLSAEGEYSRTTVTRPIGRDEFDIEFFCSIVSASEKRLIIEDFHYLGTEAQRNLAHDLKTLWDYGVYVVIVGVWHRKNYLTYLNGDLAGRITEESVGWTEDELKRSFIKGCAALNVFTSDQISSRIAKDSYSNIGILQSLALKYMEIFGIDSTLLNIEDITNDSVLEDAGMQYADQIEAIYSLFAERVSDGIRKRKNATQIYAFALWSIMDASDGELIAGLSLDWVFKKATAHQPRIQKPNLRAVLRKFKSLQEDDRGKGVILSFDEATDTVVLIDKGVLFYRKYTTQNWPWERLALESRDAEIGLEGDEDD